MGIGGGLRTRPRPRKIPMVGGLKGGMISILSTKKKFSMIHFVQTSLLAKILSRRMLWGMRMVNSKGIGQKKITGS